MGEEDLGHKTAGNDRDHMIDEAIERIQAASTANAVCNELQQHLDNERVCESALEKIVALVTEEGRRLEEEQQPFIESVYIKDMFATGGIELALTSMNNHEANVSIQENGSHLLAMFASHIDMMLPYGCPAEDAALSLLSSTRCVKAIFSAMERFPDNSQVQGAALYTIHPIQQVCGRSSEWKDNYYTNLVDADALSLSFAALEHHSNDYEAVIGALTMFNILGGASSIRPLVRQAFVSFVQNHPNNRSVIEKAVKTQERLHPGNLYVQREAFMVFCSLSMFGNT